MLASQQTTYAYCFPIHCRSNIHQLHATIKPFHDCVLGNTMKCWVLVTQRVGIPSNKQARMLPAKASAILPTINALIAVTLQK